MTRADLIAAVRTASGKPYLPERECLAIVRGVLGVVREPGVGVEIVGNRLRFGGTEFRGTDEIFTAMIDALLGEVGE